MVKTKNQQQKKANDTKPNRDRQRKLDNAVEMARAQWKSDPNIVSIGFGFKDRKGNITDEVAITFDVRRKLSSEDAILAIGSKPIPVKFEGFPTDVKVFDMAPAFLFEYATGNRDKTRFDPLVGGVMTSNAENNIFIFNTTGTLGTLCFRGNTPMALSNWHVLADGGERGDDIIQPGHPRGKQHFETSAKVGFCGPLLGSLFEWQAPSPLTGALYGGAAAAAIAAALSDQIDPTRRGQEATPTDPGERTLSEQVNMAINYIEQPITGVQYKVEVDWEYRRTTDRTVRVHSIKETKTNPHFLILKQLSSDQAKYNPGSTVHLFARIAGSYSRSCNSYYVVAHYIPDKDPSRMLSTVLTPISCEDVPIRSQEVLTCIDFSVEEPGAVLDQVIQRGAARFESHSPDKKNHIVDIDSDANGELFLSTQLNVYMPLCKRVEATVFANSETKMNAYHAGQLVGSTTAGRRDIVTLVIEAPLIDSVALFGGDPEFLSSLPKFCYLPIKGTEEHVMCCYTGHMNIPSNEQAGIWKGYLVVQNINDIPQGTSPEKAAETIGGIILSQNFSPDVIGCGAIMAADHLFDVI
jgi:hypothetical protein